MRNVKGYDVQRVISKDLIKDTKLYNMSIEVKKFKSLYNLNGIVDNKGNEIISFTQDIIDVVPVDNNYIIVNAKTRHKNSSAYDFISTLYQITNNEAIVLCTSTDVELKKIGDYVIGNYPFTNTIEDTKGNNYIYDIKSHSIIYVYDGYVKENLQNGKVILHQYLNNNKEADVFIDLKHVNEARFFESLTLFEDNAQKLICGKLISAKDLEDEDQMLYCLLNVNGDYVINPYDTYTGKIIDPDNISFRELKTNFIRKIEKDKFNNNKILKLNRL